MKNCKTLKVINLWGAPSAGKSTTAAGLFYLMKVNGYSVEYIPEYAKSLIFSDRSQMFQEQGYIMSKQLHPIYRLVDRVDYVIVDSPLPLAIYYAEDEYPDSFNQYCMDLFNLFDNVNFLLHRTDHSFEVDGRRHSEEQSLIIANELPSFMNNLNIPFTELEANPETPGELFHRLFNKHSKLITLGGHND